MTIVDANELVVLVDAADRQIGTAPKLAVHRDGRLHRAISVQIADHAAGSCCRSAISANIIRAAYGPTPAAATPPGRSVLAAAQRRLQAEMGITCALSPLFTTSYRADLDNGMIEHEIVHVFAGIYEGAIRPDPLEADGYDWVKPDALRADLSRNAERYSAWFSIYVRDHWPEVASLVPAGGAQLDDLEIA